MLTLIRSFTIPNDAPQRIRGTKISFYNDDSMKIRPSVVNPMEDEIQYMVKFVSECWSVIDDSSGKSSPPEEDGGSGP